MYTVWTIFTKRCPAYRKSKKVSRKWEGPILPWSGFSSGEVGRGGGGDKCKCVRVSKLEGSGGMLSRENFKFKSSEMAINASKPANSNTNLLIITLALKLTSYNLAPTLD